MPGEKSLVEIVLMPLAVAVVGLGGSFWITQTQEAAQAGRQASDHAAARQLAESERELKILELFFEKWASDDESDRLMALRMLEAVPSEIHGIIAAAAREAVADDPVLNEAAQQAEERGGVRLVGEARIYIHIRSEMQRAPASRLKDSLETFEFVVPGVELIPDVGPDRSELRYFRPEDEDLAVEIAARLGEAGIDVRPRHTRGYQLRPRHFELWFAPGGLADVP